MAHSITVQRTIEMIVTEGERNKRGMKRGFLVVSVGTSQIEAIEKTSVHLVRKIEACFSGEKCYLGFSNRRILEKMQAIAPDTFYSVKEALEQMCADGVEEAVILPTYLLNGIENDGMIAIAEEYREKFQQMRIGKPLLSAKEDYEEVLQALFAETSLQEEEALVLVGHGSSLSANTYQNLEYTAYVKGQRNVFVGTIDDEKNRRMTIRKLQALGYERVRLMPLLFVAAHHAKKDIMGAGASWKSALEEAGFSVMCDLRGLGELDSIQKILIAHLEETMVRPR